MTITASEHGSWRPDWAVEPGAILVETLRDHAMSQVELAQRTGRPLKTINEIVKGKTAITAETAVQLEAALGVPAGFWLNLQRDYDEHHARVRRRQDLAAHTEWAKRFPVAAMRKHRLIPVTRDPVQAVEALLSFFGVASPEVWLTQWRHPVAVFRRSTTREVDVESTSAWLRWGQRVASRTTEMRSFDKDKLRALIPTLRQLSRLSSVAFRRRVVELLRDVGVSVLYLPELPGTRVIGATHWLAGRPIIQLSLRHKTDDQFWFALFHEVAHVLQGDRGAVYVDGVDRPELTNDETRADAFAADALIPRARLDEFVEAGNFSATAIRRFADELDVAAGVVVGQLEHRNRVKPGALSYLKTRIDWVHS